MINYIMDLIFNSLQLTTGAWLIISMLVLLYYGCKSYHKQVISWGIITAIVGILYVLLQALDALNYVIANLI